jgi:acyl-coenzyme A thioesterase PaaI-like protein
MRELPASKTAAFERMIGELRGFLDKVAGAHPDEATLAALADDLAAWSGRLGGCAVAESEQLFGRLVGEPGRGQTMMPRLVLEDAPPGEVRGHVVFGRYFLGVNGAAHGGALPLLFDEVLGIAAAAPDRPRVRTAYLHVDFRALTPLDTRLEVRGWLDRQEGRKRFVRGELRCGDVLCAEAEALFVELKPGQA